MRVKLRSIYASAITTAAPGDVLELPDAEAEALIAGRFADPVSGPAPVGDAPLLETAEDEHEDAETADAPRVRRRR